MVLNMSKRPWYTQVVRKLIKIKGFNGLRGGSLKVNILLIGPLLIGPPIKAWWIAAY